MFPNNFLSQLKFLNIVFKSHHHGCSSKSCLGSPQTNYGMFLDLLCEHRIVIYFSTYIAMILLEFHKIFDTRILHGSTINFLKLQYSILLWSLGHISLLDKTHISSHKMMKEHNKKGQHRKKKKRPHKVI